MLKLLNIITISVISFLFWLYFNDPIYYAMITALIV